MRINWDAFTNRTVTTADVRLLGTVDLSAMLALQKLVIHDVRQQGRINAAILICEHPAAVTMPLGGSLLQLPAERRDLDARLLQVHRVRRDGPAILHQPGQLAIYVIVSLADCGIPEDSFRSHLATAVIAACAEQQVVARYTPNDATAIHGRHGVIADLAIQVEQGVTGFGIFLNATNPLIGTDIVGRGLLGQKISSLDAERVRPTRMAPLRSSLIQHLTAQLGYPEYNIHTGHPFLTRAKAVKHDKPSHH